VNWIIFSKIIAAIVTLIIVYLSYKEIKDMIRRDKAGEKSKKCELD